MARKAGLRLRLPRRVAAFGAAGVLAAGLILGSGMPAGAAAPSRAPSSEHGFSFLGIHIDLGFLGRDHHLPKRPEPTFVCISPEPPPYVHHHGDGDGDSDDVVCPTPTPPPHRHHHHHGRW